MSPTNLIIGALYTTVDELIAYNNELIARSAGLIGRGGPRGHELEKFPSPALSFALQFLAFMTHTAFLLQAFLPDCFSLEAC